MAENPFKILESFEQEDKDRFFGRTRETAQLFNALQLSNHVLVYGASGTGKTSLIQCGLANKYSLSDWLPIFVKRVDNLNKSLRTELEKYFEEERDRSTPLRFLVQDIYLDYYRPVYLIFDQFEELYILGTRKEQHEFHRTISELLQAGLQCKVILVIREEYLAYLDDFERIVPSLFDNRLRIEKMDNRNLRRVIIGTTKYGDITLKEAKTTISSILKNLRSKREGIELTNLQVYLDRLWREDIKRQETPAPESITFDPDLVDSIGKVDNVLSDFLDEQLKLVEDGLRVHGMAKPEGMPLELLFTLVTEDGTKRNLDIETLSKSLPKHRPMKPDEIAYCLDKFYELKLLRKFAES